MEVLKEFLPSMGTAVAVVLTLFLLQRALDRNGRAAANRFRNQILMLVASAVGLLLFLLVVPIGDATRGDLLGLIGIVLSAAIALSSTTFLVNAMAGILTRTVRNFRIGDFIRVEKHFGRVSERGLFHTEIQTEDRELTTMPNLYLVTKPVTTIRTSGTVIAARVSLGYDVPRSKVEQLLLEAARESDLTDPFVHVKELGDSSVTYRVAGILTDVKHLVSRRSRLRGNVMDALHRGRVEIVSPTFMNQRVLSADRTFIPTGPLPEAEPKPWAAPEEVVFDKAEKAESLEALRETRREAEARLAELAEQYKSLGEGEERDRVQAEIDRRKELQERLDAIIARREEEAAKGEK